VSGDGIGDRASPQWTWAGWALVGAAFVVGFVNFPLQVLGTQLEYLPGDPADNRLNNYILEHGYRCLTGHSADFWNAPIYYPAPGVTAWSDAHLGMLPSYAAMRAVGLSPERAFQGHFILCFVLNFAAAAWAIRRLGFGPVGVAIGAYVFSFALPLSAQLQHTQLYPRFLIPPALVFTWEFLRTPRAWRLIAAAWCIAGQVYLTVYIGYFLTLFIALASLLTIVCFPRQLPWRELMLPNRREMLIRVTGVVFAGLAVLWLVKHHRVGGSEVDSEHVKYFAPKPKAWLTPPSNALACIDLADWIQPGTGMHNSDEQQLCPGIIPLTAIVLGTLVVVWPRRFGGKASVVAICALTALLIGLLFTRFGDTWYYERIAKLPGARGIRAIGRVVLVLLFPAAVVMAAGADLLFRAAARAGRTPAVVAAVLLLVVTMADQWLSRAEGEHAVGWVPMRCELDNCLDAQAHITEAIRSQSNPRLLYAFPTAIPGGLLAVQVAAMRSSQDCGIPCVNGWSGHAPKGWDYFANRQDVLRWLNETNHVPPELTSGLVFVGEPSPAAK
jgi:hypothetical protein